MQDGAAPHTVKNSWDWLTANFNQCVIDLKNRLRVGPLLSRPEPYGLSMGSLKEPGIKGFTRH